jgi:hypothetical protein
MPFLMSRFLMGVIGPMILSGGLVQSSADAIARKILDERVWHCKTMRLER